MENQNRDSGHGQREQTSHRKRRSGGRTVGLVIGTLLLVIALTGTMIAGIFMIYVKTTLTPSLDVDASEYTMNLSSIIYYQDKTSGEWVELQTLHGKENRIWVDYGQMPEALWQAAVAIEDKRFFDHKGVDWSRTATATVNMFLGMKNTYGGSTITQQLLKNITKDNAGTVNRKVREIFRALEFEKSTSKQDILELYLNTIYLGKSCYGVETAAEYYFGKDVSELSVAECASLVAITNNPALFGPMSTVKITAEDGTVKTARDMNKSRQENILYQMLDQKYITQEQYDDAMSEELQFTDGSTSVDELVAAAAMEQGGAPDNGINSYFVDQVFNDVAGDLSEQLGISLEMAETKLYNGGYNIYTTLDPDIQAIAESVYEDRSNLDVTSKSGQKLQSGITIVDVTNGNVVAMVGQVGEKTSNRLWNFATDVQQCGSSIKPLSVYAPALDSAAITMASTFDNYPVRLLNDSPWPKNSPQGYTGWTTLSTGVAKSINTVAVQVIEKLGTSNSFRFLTENLSMTTLVSPEENAATNDLNTASLGLGGLTRGTTTEQMAAAYASFANEGIYNSPRLYERVTQGTGADETVILENETETHAAMKETTAYFMNKLLQGVITSGTGGSANFGNMAIAGKTGTTSDNYDRYFVGYTPYYSAAVWTGYRNNEYIKYSGNPAITMWKKVMSQIHENLEYKSFSKPSSGLTTVTVCADSGLLATDACAVDIRGESRVRQVEVAAGTGPTDFCTMHTLIDYCTEGKCIAGDHCPADLVKQVSVLDWTRVDYGEGIVADDNPYLLSTLQAIAECPVHAGMPLPEDPEEETPGGSGETGEQPTNPGGGTSTPGGNSGGNSGGNTGEDPSGGFGDATWWNNLWNGGSTPSEPTEP